MSENAGICPQVILDLVKRFEEHHESYRRPDYKEAELRREFIDPFFEALGWDISNKSGKSETFKDVVLEESLKIGGTTKAPDYAFRIGGARVFFIEAKKPSHDLQTDSAPACQLRRYAWNAKLVLSILTDFEEFALYDCRVKPSAKDKAVTARILYLNFKEYTARWSEIADLISREAVERGSLERFRASEKGKRGTSAVDDEFLKDIERWRNLLTRNLALRNRRISELDLNTSVQRILDRIIFLRIAEDRGIERFRQLQDILARRHIYRELCNLFQRADERYNSGLFHFHKEKDRSEPPDELTLQLKVDDAVLKEIIGHLYYPECQYEFSVISADILGNIYEQFLGKVIRMTKGHRAVVEEKPEVKKAGGVYYTPTYIVDYIVKNTVGKLCEGKTPKEIAALRILDPACGSGSFLIGAYTYLLNVHLDWYLKDGASKHGKEVYRGTGGQWRLTTQEKKRVLLNNIYGVDIDRQAVEVTKLSLLLKVLEGENEQTLERQMTLFHERALPDLGDNIKCGNSLIGPDYFQGQLIPDKDEIRRVNAFDWPAEFPSILGWNIPERRRGFDAVIGNPPYIRIQMMKEWAPREVEYCKEHYVSANTGNYDIYVVFVERGLHLINKTGRLGFILPHKFFNAQYGEPLRGLLSKGRYLSEVVHFGDQQVFAKATTYTCLMFLNKATSVECQLTKVSDLKSWRTEGKATKGIIPATSIASTEWNFAVGKGAGLIEKLGKMPVKLGDIADIFVGTQTSADDVFVLDECHQAKTHIIGISKSLDKKVRVEDSCTKPFLRGKDIRRYEPLNTHSRLICPYEIANDSCCLIPQPKLKSVFPLAFSYLDANRTFLMRREKGKFCKANWHAFGYPKSMTLFQRPKIIVPDYNNVASFTFDNSGHFYKTGYGIILKNHLHPLYVLGLLNSPVLFNYLLSIGTSLRGGYVRFWTQFIEQLPIRSINFSDVADKARHDRMVTLVDRMLDLHRRLAAAKAEEDKTPLQRQIASTDREIDQLVYDLYGLTAEEIRIVEEGAKQ